MQYKQTVCRPHFTGVAKVDVDRAGNNIEAAQDDSMEIWRYGEYGEDVMGIWGMTRDEWEMRESPGKTTIETLRDVLGELHIHGHMYIQILISWV